MPDFFTIKFQVIIVKQNKFLGSSYPIVPLSLLFLGAALWPELELLVPSLPGLKVFFGVSEGQIQQLLSANFIGFLGGVLFAGPLCDSFGRRAISLGGMLIFLIASALAPMVTSFEALLAIRFLQGIAVTGPIIGGSTLLVELTLGHKQIFWMSISNASITLCMAMAPIIGAFINESFGYSGNLWAIFVLAFVGILPFMFFVPESLAKENRASFRMSEIVRNYGLLLKNARFLGMSLAISGLASAYWIYTGVSSLYLIDHLKLDPALFGLYQGPIVGTFAAFSIGINWIHKKLGLSLCLWAGFFAMLIGAVPLVFLASIGQESALMTTICMMFFVGGMVPACSLLFASALNQLPANLQGCGQSFIQALRLLMASIGTVILGVTYSGPFLPVSLIMFFMFIASSVLLYKMRFLIIENKGDLIIAGH